jgi:curved DNA-binding protein CbpA
MDETFYDALGVDAEAEAGAIRDAYRERVKERHPDVSDDPGAPREFKRLTTARDVLVDETERDRYDRLGHATYVRRHLQGGSWSTDESTSTDTKAAGTAEKASGQATARKTAGRTRNPDAEGTAADRRTWLGEDWERPSHRSAAAPSSSRGHPGESEWQQASEAYRYRPSGVPTETATLRDRVRSIGGTLGPWLVVHAVFLVAALGVGWLLYERLAASTGLPMLAAAAGVILVGLALFLSTLHVVSLRYG